MKISKTLFKNLMRCPNFASLINMHQNRAAHDVKILNDLDEANLDNILNNISNEIIYSGYKDATIVDYTSKWVNPIDTNLLRF